MKTLNKYQIKAQADRVARIARGELKQIADRAIATARAAAGEAYEAVLAYREARP